MPDLQATQLRKGTTIVFELVNFVVLMLLLKRFLFRPVRRVLFERGEKVALALAEAKTASMSSTN